MVQPSINVKVLNQTANGKLVSSAISHRITLDTMARRHAEEISSFLAKYNNALRGKVGDLLNFYERTYGKLAPEHWPTIKKNLQPYLQAYHKGILNVRNQSLSTLGKMGSMEAQWQQRALQDALPPGINIPFAVPNQQAIDLIAQTVPMNKLPLGGHWAKLSANAKQRVNNAVKAGVIEGRSTREIAKSVGLAAQTTRRHAETLALTGVSHTTNNARFLMYQENQDVIKGWQFIATLDDRTTPDCADMDGRTFTIGEGQNETPPLHHRCRSTTAPVLKSWKELGLDAKDTGATQRAALGGPVGGKVKYKDWLKAAPLETKINALGKELGTKFDKGQISWKGIMEQKKMPASLLKGKVGPLRAAGKAEPSFRSAKTPKGAEDFTRRLGVNIPDAKAMRTQNVEVMNLVNRGLVDLKNKGYKMPTEIRFDTKSFSKIFGPEAKDCPAYFDFMGNKPFININPSNKYFKNPSKFACDGWFSTKNPRSVIYHEYGHYHHYGKLKGKADIMYKPVHKSMLVKIRTDVSFYAAEDWGEFYAEVFSGIMDGKKYDKEIISWFKAVEKGRVPKPTKARLARMPKAMAKKKGPAGAVKTKETLKFKKAKNIEAAKKATKDLGIDIKRVKELDSFKDNNVASLNLINDGLTDLKNLGFEMPKNIKFDWDEFYSNGAWFSRETPGMVMMVDEPGFVPIINFNLDSDFFRYAKTKWGEGLFAGKTRKAVVYHEYGHWDLLNKINLDIKAVRKFHMEPAKAFRAKMAKKVSHYANTNWSEFYAEVFSGIIEGKKYDDEIMGWYKTLQKGKVPKLPKPMKAKAMKVKAPVERKVKTSKKFNEAIAISEHKKWVKNLSEAALYDIDTYTDEWSGIVRKAMVKKQKTNEYYKMGIRIQNELKTQPPWRGEIHRGLSFDRRAGEKFVDQIVNSNGFKTQAIASFSRSLGIAKKFAAEKDVRVILHVKPKTARLIEWAAHPTMRHEKEVLAFMGTRYKLVTYAAKDLKQGGRSIVKWDIWLEEI